MTFLEAGWDAVNLGPDTPLSSLVRAIDKLRPSIVWLSVSHMEDWRSFANAFRTLVSYAANSGVAVVVGGRALSDEIRSRIPRTAHGETLNDLASQNFDQAVSSKADTEAPVTDPVEQYKALLTLRLREQIVNFQTLNRENHTDEKKLSFPQT